MGLSFPEILKFHLVKIQGGWRASHYCTRSSTGDLGVSAWETGFGSRPQRACNMTSHKLP